MPNGLTYLAMSKAKEYSKGKREDLVEETKDRVLVVGGAVHEEKAFERGKIETRNVRVRGGQKWVPTLAGMVGTFVSVLSNPISSNPAKHFVTSCDTVFLAAQTTC